MWAGLGLGLAASIAGAPSQGQTAQFNGITPKSSTLTAFLHGRIVVSPQTTLGDGTIIFENGKIVAVGEKLSAPIGATVVDLAGRTVYSGFIDPLTEYGVKKPERKRERRETAPAYDTDRTGAVSWNAAVHPEDQTLNGFAPDDKAAKEFLDNGFTAAYSVLRDGIFRGRGLVALLGKGLPNDVTLVGESLPSIAFNKGSSTQDYPSSLMGSIALVRQTYLDADWYAKSQKAYTLNPAQQAPEFNASLAAQVATGITPAIFETADPLEALRANRIGREFGFSYILVGSGFEYQYLTDLKATGSSIILPLSFPKSPEVSSLDDELDVSLADLRHWERAAYNPGALEKAGVSFALTTSSLKDKSSFWKNLRVAVKRGLTKSGALAALTTAPASMLGVSSLVGTIAPGKFANFVVTNTDIFEDSAKIMAVWVAGEKTEVTAEPPTDVRGEYALSFSNYSWPLSLGGERDKLKGSVKVGEAKKDLSGLTIKEDFLQYSLKLDTLARGTYRFSGRANGDTLAGLCSTPDGRSVQWSALLTGPFVPSKDSADSSAKKGDGASKKPDNDSLISHMTYPTHGFGPSSPAAQEDVLIKNATVWTSEADGILANTDVLVQKGKFTKVGKDLTAPVGTRVIDAAGKHLTAGIIDEHSHIAISGNVNDGVNAISAEVRIGDVVDPEDVNIYRQLAGGVTASELLHGSANPIGGQAQVIKLRWGLGPEALKFAGCPPTIKFALGENVKQSNWGDLNTTRYPQSRLGVETFMKDRLQLGKEYDAAWKAYNALGASARERAIPPRRDLQLDAMSDILNGRMFVHCHSYVQSEILMLMRLAEEYGFRIQTFTHILEGYKVADEMARHGASGSSFADWWAYKFEVYEAIPYNNAIMASRGVVTSVNSDDAEMARRLNQEAGKIVKYGGMTPEEAIKLCTINPAKMLKVDGQVGSIKVGKDADFVIWNDYPLSVYAKAEQTWIDGRKYFDLDSDRALREALQVEKAALVQKALASGPSGGGDKSGYKQPGREWHCEDILDEWKGKNR